MSMADIRRQRGVPAKRGMRVRYTGGKVPHLGTIRSAKGGYLMIQLDGTSGTRPFHPTWELEYITATATNGVRARSAGAATDN